MSDSVRVNPRRTPRQDPHYVNRVVAESRPDITADAAGQSVVPAEPPWLQPAPPAATAAESDAWQATAVIPGPPGGVRVTEESDPEASPEPDQGDSGVTEGSGAPDDPGASDGDQPDTGNDPASNEPAEDANMGDGGVKPEAELRGMSRQRLVNYATSQGVTTGGRDSKEDIVIRLVEAGKVRS